MRTLSIVCLAVTILSPVFATDHDDTTEQTTGHHAEQAESQEVALPAALELAELLELAGAVRLDEVTVADIVDVADLISVAARQEAYVRRAAGLSVLVPGLGHYAIGSRTRAFGYFAADLFLHGTAAVVAYLLLPAPLKFSNLNYLQTPISDIENRWKSLTPADYLPAVAVGVSASILSAIVRQTASRDARAVAIEAVRNPSADLNTLH